MTLSFYSAMFALRLRRAEEEDALFWVLATKEQEQG